MKWKKPQNSHHEEKFLVNFSLRIKLSLFQSLWFISLQASISSTVTRKKVRKKNNYIKIFQQHLLFRRDLFNFLMLSWQRFDAVPVVFALATPSNSHHDYTRVKFVVWIVSCFILWSWNINRRNWVARCGVFVLKTVFMFTNNYLYVLLNVFISNQGDFRNKWLLTCRTVKKTTLWMC